MLYLEAETKKGLLGYFRTAVPNLGVHGGIFQDT